MKKSNINVLLVALTSAVALAACGSGSSSPAPTPTPIPTPTPSPTPSPTPTPTPVPGESGVYALAGVLSSGAIQATYSTTPSTNTWVNFVSGTNQPFVTAVASESAALLLSTSTNNGLVTASTNTTLSYGIYGTAGAQVASQNTSIPVTVTVYSNTANTNTVTLPAIPATQLASNGSNAVVIVPTAAYVTGAGANSVVATATNDSYNIYTISAAGVPTLLAGYYNLNGVYTAIPAASVQTAAAVFFINGMYYAYNVTANNQLLQSSDGVSWQQITNNTAVASNYLTNVVQVSGSVFAAIDDSGIYVYLGSSPANLTNTGLTLGFNGFIAANGTGSLYISNDDVTTADNLQIYTPTASTLGSVVANNALFTTIPNRLVFAGGNVYSVNNTAGTLSALTITGSTITQATTPASTVTAAGTIVSPILAQNGVSAPAGRFVAMGSNILALNSSAQALSGTDAAEVASISAIAANGAATYNNLPSGVNVLAKAFAGTTSGYMLALNNGDVLVSSANGFVQASTVLDPTNGRGAALSQLVSANGTYLASDATNLYYSADNGTTWTTITPATAGAGTGGGAALSINAAANGLYFISVVAGTGATIATGTYQTATPQTLSTWVAVSGIPAQSQATYWGGTYYTLTNASNDVGVYNPATGQTVINPDVLPQNAVSVGGAFNVAYSGSTYALAQVASNYLWTSTDLIGGIGGWTQNVAAFTGVNGVVLSSETFSGPLVWTGKVWVATGNAGNMYTATAPTAFAVGTYTNAQGITTAVNGGVSANLF